MKIQDRCPTKPQWVLRHLPWVCKVHPPAPLILLRLSNTAATTPQPTLPNSPQPSLHLPISLPLKPRHPPTQPPPPPRTPTPTTTTTMSSNPSSNLPTTEAENLPSGVVSKVKASLGLSQESESGTEPVSGEMGSGTAGEPFDLGNEEGECYS